MVERLTGKDAQSARQLARESGISQETLSRWLREARSLPEVPRKPKSRLAHLRSLRIRNRSVEEGQRTQAAVPLAALPPSSSLLRFVSDTGAKM